MKIFFIVTTLLAAMLADLLIGSFGFSVSLTAGTLLYFSGSFGLRHTLPAAVAAGVFLDMCYARPEAFSAAALLAATAAGMYFMPSREYRNSLIRSLPVGAAAEGVFVLANAAALSCIYGKTGYPSGIIAHLTTSMLFGTLCFPGLVILFDAVAGMLNLPRYLASAPEDILPQKNTGGAFPVETASRRRREQ